MLQSVQVFVYFLVALVMSSQKQKDELLACGYVKQNYKYAIPMVINKLIELFYNKYFYWKIKKDEMQKFFGSNKW